MNGAIFKNIKVMENNFADMSPEAIAKRKEEIARRRKLAELVWNTMMNEGDVYEKEYWIKGFCIAIDYN